MALLNIKVLMRIIEISVTDDFTELDFELSLTPVDPKICNKKKSLYTHWLQRGSIILNDSGSLFYFPFD